MNQSFKLYTEIAISQDGIRFYLTSRNEQDIKYIVNLNGTIQLLDGIQHPIPTFFLSTENSQQLIDCLYRLGIRPTETTSTIDAMIAHIHDLQSMIAHLKSSHNEVVDTDKGPFRLPGEPVITKKQKREQMS